ncbi:MAG: hypothetical protein Kow00124_25180 [Anaerolineae bacterium]
MAFGTIVIQTEDGSSKYFELTKPATTVGRQPTNDIVLSTTSVSRYHARFDVAEGRVFVVDLESVHGTFVNDVQIAPETPMPLNDGDAVTMGEVRLTFYSPEARSYVSLMPGTGLISRPDVPFRLILDEPQQSVAPGARLQLILIIENALPQDALFRVSTGGLDPDWVSVNRREAQVLAGQMNEVVITVRPPRMASTNPGRYALTVRVELADNPRQALEAVREIDVVGYSGLGAALLGTGREGVYEIVLQNHGNLPADLSFSGYDREGLLSYSFNPRRVTLKPGTEGQAMLTVRLRRGRSLSQARRVRFAAVITSRDAAGFHAPLPSVYTIEPSWPTLIAGLGIPVILLGVALVAAVVLAAVIYFVDPFNLFPAAQPTEAADQGFGAGAPGIDQALAPTLATPLTTPQGPLPQIAAFTADPAEVIFATEGQLTFSWQAQNHTNIRLYNWEDTGLLDPDNISTNQLVLKTADLPLGDLAFRLLVWNEYGQEEQTLRVSVRPTTCVLLAGAVIRTRPADDASAVSMARTGPVILAGREEGDQPVWAYVTAQPSAPPPLTIKDLEEVGWVRADQLACDVPVDLASYAVREP